MAVDERLEALVQFGRFELDPGNHQLRRSGLPLDLPPQALKILVLLAGRAGELVSRGEVKEALWPGEAHGDFDSRLNFAVKKLREALGDDAEQPLYVQTVRNAGYRFIAPVREAHGDSASEGRDNASREISRGVSGVPIELTRRAEFIGRRPLAVALVAVAALAVSVAALALRRSEKVAALGSSAPAGTSEADVKPIIYSVTPVSPQARQRIVIRGTALGLHVPYAHTDSPYLAIRDVTAHWAAGRLLPQNWDEVMVDVESWTNTEIAIRGFSGDYGVNGWTLAPGDEVEVAVWNPQSGVGPALFHTRVVTPESKQ